MRARLIGLALGLCLACTPTEDEVDPLDPDLIRELALAQGSAGGDAHSGAWSFDFASEGCDCPSVELDEQSIDLCALASLSTVEFELAEGSGVLGLTVPAVPDFGLLTGAIEADGSFVVAGIQDVSTLAGPLEAIRRLDGQFSDDDASAEGTGGQRLLGELPGQSIDCRWTGQFSAMRL